MRMVDPFRQELDKANRPQRTVPCAPVIIPDFVSSVVK